MALRRLTKEKKVAIGMSGGVDSSVAAVLLAKAGFIVVGVFMKFWKEGGSGENRCCSADSEKRARAVAKKLDIPFYVFNCEKEFKKKIVDNFLSDYQKGATPNPCVVCNKEIKFGLFLEKAMKMGADYIATGHYACLRQKIPNPKPEIRRNPNPLADGLNPKRTEFKLIMAKDKKKDQSYFLWQLNQKQLSRVLFPIGGYAKPEIRKMAKKFGLPVSNTPDSQEICFVPKNINDFLKKYLRPKAGNIIDMAGKVIGKHEGLHFYTIGQRKGIKLPQGPYYVVKKDFKKNNLIVSKNEEDLSSRELFAKDINWISGKEMELPRNITAKIRYRSKLSRAIIKKSGDSGYKLTFTAPQRAITSGQSVVFYKGSELLGGGVIDRSL